MEMPYSSPSSQARFSSPPPSSAHALAPSIKIKTKAPPMLPAAELYLALKDEATLLNYSFEDPGVLEDISNLYVPAGRHNVSENILYFEPAMSACKHCSSSAGVRHVLLAYELHKRTIPIERCLEILSTSSSMIPEQLQSLHQWIFNKFGLPGNWPRCDIYMSLRRGCPSLLQEFRGDGVDPRLLAMRLEVPMYGAVDFDPMTNACAHCPDIQIIKHIWEACSRRGIVVSAAECMMALQKSPLTRKDVVKLLKWLSFRFNLPQCLPTAPDDDEKAAPHRDLVRMVLEELPVIRAKPMLLDFIVDESCVNNITSFLLHDTTKLSQPRVPALNPMVASVWNWTSAGTWRTTMTMTMMMPRPDGNFTP